MKHFTLICLDESELIEQMQLAEIEIEAQKDLKFSLLITGDSLSIIHCSEELKRDFLRISNKVDVVIACRVSPKQKAEIVQMTRNAYPNKVTLAIGDGANDVSMITTAHVGVGIMGLEGSQAARSADFAIG
jgi:phospholipid-transporting ATPase